MSSAITDHLTQGITMATKKSKPKGRGRGQIIERGKDTFLLRVFTGKDAAGKRKYASRTVKGSYREAERELTKMVSEVDAQTFIAPAKDTVEAFLHTWLDSRKVEEGTRRNYHHHITRDIGPVLGHLKIQKVAPQDMQKAVNGWVADGYAPNTVRRMYMLMASAMKKAVNWGLINRTPCVDIELPKVTKREAMVLSAEETRHFLEVNKDATLFPLWSILLTCGLRPGEVRALKFSDFDGETLNIHSAVKNATRTIGDTKTAAGRRKVSVPASTARIIEQHRARMAREVFSGRRPQNPEGFMFLTRNGTVIDAKDLLMSWRRALRRAGLNEKLRLYDTRHTHITHLLEAGVSHKIVSERAGHASSAITLDVYSHVMPQLQKQTADTVENLLYGTNA